MSKGSYHPKAFLMYRRNVVRGLEARTKIVSGLESASLVAKNLSERTGVRYASVLYHIHLMEGEHIVARQGGRPYVWKLTGIGQKRLTET